MAIIIITLYKTVVFNNVVQEPSSKVTLYIDDTNIDGLIDRTEWSNYTGNPYGHIAGDTSPAALFNSTTGNTSSGTLYSPNPYIAGENIATILKNLDRSKYQPAISDLNICYLAGTLIAAPAGEIPVETLRAGDLVLTRDNGPQPLIWTGHTHVSRRDLDLAPNKRPIRIQPGALGADKPRRAVDVSPQHRVMVTDPAGKEYLISARHLMMAGMPGVALHPPGDDLRLIHLACAEHQLLLAEGAAMESFFTGKMAIRALSPSQRMALLICFPSLGVGGNPMTPARPIIKHREFSRMRSALI